MARFLLEIGVEEVPAGYIRGALESLRENFMGALAESRLTAGEVTTTGTPRRLVFFADDLVERQEDLEVVMTGPPAKVGQAPDGSWTKAALGFARSQGVGPEALFISETAKGKYVAARAFKAGRAAREVLAEALPGVIRAIRFPKSMKWSADRTLFARPLRRIVALLEGEIVPFEVAGVASGRQTSGHYFLAPEKIVLEKADYATYRDALRNAFVLIDFEERRAVLSSELERVAAANGWTVAEGKLLDEVANLLEYPRVLVGKFDEEFLKVPEDVLIEAMKSHQRYFPVRDAGTGKLSPHFLCGYNRTDKTVELIREGNERVLRARLADAAFFFESDRRKKLEDRLPALEKITFQEKLGSYLAKAKRMEKVALEIAPLLGLDESARRFAARAALLAKADLTTEMVYEFPSLEGVMGREYARLDGEPAEVAVAIGEHYLPRSPDDPVPASETGVVAALADKFDSLAGCFWARLAPSGSEDPYALRRRAQGIIRIVLERKLPLDAAEALRLAGGHFEADAAKLKALVEEILAFMRDRFYNMMLEKGCRFDLIRSVLALPINDFIGIKKRLDAVIELSGQPGWPRLVTVVTRAHNITKGITGGGVRAELLKEAEEQALAEHWRRVRPEIEKKIAVEDFIGACDLFSGPLAERLHEFFEKVYVNVEDAGLRTNRLSLVAEIRDLFENNIAVLTEVQSDDSAQGIPGKI